MFFRKCSDISGYFVGSGILLWLGVSLTGHGFCSISKELPVSQPRKWAWDFQSNYNTCLTCIMCLTLISKYGFEMALWGQYYYYVHFTSSPGQFICSWNLIRLSNSRNWALEAMTTLQGVLTTPSLEDTLDHPPFLNNHLILPLETKLHCSFSNHIVLII